MAETTSSDEQNVKESFTHVLYKRWLTFQDFKFPFLRDATYKHNPRSRNAYFPKQKYDPLTENHESFARPEQSSARTRCLLHTLTPSSSTHTYAWARVHTLSPLESLVTSPTQLNATAGVSPTSWRFKGPEERWWVLLGCKQTLLVSLLLYILDIVAYFINIWREHILNSKCTYFQAFFDRIKSKSKSKSALLSILPHVPYIHTENWNCVTLLLPGAYR